MKLTHTQSLIASLSNSNLLIDTTTLINASNSDDFLELLKKLVVDGCQLITIPSVIYEFTRCAQDIATLDKQYQFIDELSIIVLGQVEKQVSDEKTRVFMFIYNRLFKDKTNKAPSYTDSLLCAMTYKYRNSGTGIKLLTSNHKDIPLGLFDRDEVISIDIKDNIYNEAIYSLSESKLSSQLARLK